MGFEYFCLAGAGKWGLAALWCQGIPARLLTLPGRGMVLPQLPLPPYTHHSPIASAPIADTGLAVLPKMHPVRLSLCCTTSF